MKKGMTMLAVLLAAGVATASIWNEDFTGETKQVDATAYGAAIGDTATAGWGTGASYDTWYMGANGIIAGNWSFMTDFLQVKAVSNVNASRAAVIVLDGSGIAAGDYTLQWDFSMYANAEQTVQVFDLEANDGAYNVKYAQGATVAPALTSSNATASVMGSFTQYHAPGSGALNVPGQTLDFTYDGTGDIGLSFGISATTAWDPLLTIDNVSITAIPEPATIGLIGIGGLFMMYARRRVI